MTKVECVSSMQNAKNQNKNKSLKQNILAATATVALTGSPSSSEIGAMFLFG